MVGHLRAGVKISGRDRAFRDAGNRCRADRHAGRGQRVHDDDTPETLSERMLGVEHRIYPAALRLLASGKVRLEGDICKTSDGADPDGTLISPAAI